MGLLDYLSGAFAVAVELSYYVIGTTTSFVITKLIEFHILTYHGSCEDLFAKRVKPPYSLVLDLDDSILHSVRTRGNNETSSVALTMGNRVLNFTVYKRPHLDAFLMEMRKDYEIVLYSTQSQSYVDACLSDACINHLFDRKLYRRDCILGADGSFIRDFSKVGSDMSKVVVLHNPLQEDFKDLPNIVPIDNWFGGHSDTALLDVMPFLQSLTNLDDVRYVLGLRCSDTRGYNGFRHPDYIESPALSPKSCISPDIPQEMDYWDTIGARLTTRVKDIFNTMSPEAEVHTPSASPTNIQSDVSAINNTLQDDLVTSVFLRDSRPSAEEFVGVREALILHLHFLPSKFSTISSPWISRS
ncbi:dullard-like phosphatase domain containing protein [Babesia ovis]|uniref:Mitochondrial import inner membrane translocase subunit TIM50 n=1 Tax=Babesia ovis TaxID=5869 RepID=A0A9W5TEG4_BABOV|nr:dullard-like phosphatase domain containing protein [Babesia ovis]